MESKQEKQREHFNSHDTCLALLLLRYRIVEPHRTDDHHRTANLDTFARFAAYR